MPRLLAIALSLLAVLGIVAFVRYGEPSPRAPEPGRFSALRAREVHARLVAAGGATRAVGTPGHVAAEKLLVAELEKLGFTTDVQAAYACSVGACAPVRNIVARLPGRERNAVLLTAHYDSVPVSPGASDDGVGTATLLEAARVLAESGKLRRTLLVVLTDGEEVGLLGAGAFVREHPLATSVHATINVDARGSRGPSQMFETSAGNAAVVSVLASHLERPVTTSLFYEVYKRLPNDTDFSVTKQLGPGVNFANTDGIEHYHTPLDQLDVASLGTLQHHGDHVVGVARAFAERDLAASTSNAIWFDVLALRLFAVPERAVLPVAILVLVVLAVHAFRARAFDRGLAAFFAMVLGAVGTAFVVGKLLSAVGAVVAPWMAMPGPALLAIQAAALAAALAVWSLLGANPRSLWAGTWLGWGILGVVTAGIAPGASYLFVVPALVAAATGALRLELAALVPMLAANALVFAIATSLYVALGFAAVPLLALPTALTATTLAPVLPGLARPRRLAAILGGVAAVAIVVAVLVPKFTAAHPQRVNVVVRQDDGAGARAFVDTSWKTATWASAPPAMVKAIGATKEAGLFPWSPASPYADLPALELPPPTAEVIATSDEGGRHRVLVRIASARGAGTVGLYFPFPAARRVEAKVLGKTATSRALGKGQLLLFVGVEGPLTIELAADGGEPLKATLFDRSPGVPPTAEPAVRARGSAGTAFQDGDGTVRTTTISL